MVNVKEILFASNNANKLKEIREIFRGATVRAASEATNRFSPQETGTTFCENAYIKAKKLYELTHHPLILADDSGLEVFALNGAPGIFSSRFSKEGSDKANLNKLLLLMLNKTHREARFTCCMIAILNGNTIIGAEGHIYGTISREPYGTSGFGYDPVFIPDGYNVTFAQMRMWEKNSISHRKKAAENLKNKLNTEVP